MKKNILVFTLTIVLSLIVYKDSFNTFFAQDDFVLINEFSQNNLIEDLENSFGLPKITHWRPLHNFYFLISGNLFDKNYEGYHILTFIIHIIVSLLIYKVVNKITGDFKAAWAASFIYVIHPAHFVTLFWISGSATTIGFFFLLLAFYLYLQEKKTISVLSFLLSLLASEAMLAGIAIFLFYRFLFEDKKIADVFLKKLFITSGIFAAVRFLFLTPKSTYDAYQIKIWPTILTNTKYYLLRIAGFAEVSGDLLISIVLFALLLFLGFILIKNLFDHKNIKIIFFSLFLIILGLFPFILISDLLSSHYMNISIFGFAILFAFSVSKIKQPKAWISLGLFILVSLINVNDTYENHWVVERSNLAKRYIEEIEKAKIPDKSTIVFNDNYISTSFNAYIALGTGKALDFWFNDKNYKACFTVFEKCSN